MIHPRIITRGVRLNIPIGNALARLPIHLALCLAAKHPERLEVHEAGAVATCLSGVMEGVRGALLPTVGVRLELVGDAEGVAVVRLVEAAKGEGGRAGGGNAKIAAGRGLEREKYKIGLVKERRNITVTIRYHYGSIMKQYGSLIHIR